MPERKSFLHLVSLYLIAIFFVILNIVDIRIAGLAKVLPMFDLMMVFYFASFRRVFGLAFIFLLGLWNDALMTNPLGATALCYILVVKLFLVLNHRMLIRENFTQVWRQFIFFCLIFLILKWMVLSSFSGVPYNIVNPLLQFVLTSAFYVIMHKFFDYLSKKLLGDI